ERSPAAVAVLEAEEPADHPLVQPKVLFVLRSVQGQQHHRRIVDIRAEWIVEFKTPTGRFWIRIVHHPIPSDSDLLRHGALGDLPALPTRRLPGCPARPCSPGRRPRR